MGSKQTGGGMRQPVSPQQQAANRERFKENIFIPRDTGRYNPATTPRPANQTNFANLYDSIGMGQAANLARNMPQQSGPIGSVRTASPQPNGYMAALNPQAGGNYNTALQQQLANNSAASQAPQSSFMGALNQQQGVTYNTDMQKRLANASAMSQGLPPPYPGY